MTETDNQNARAIELTADIASAYVGNNSVALSDLPILIKGIFGALTGADTSLEKPVEPQTPAVFDQEVLKSGLFDLSGGRPPL
jgi:predicted transcriptional regulator